MRTSTASSQNHLLNWVLRYILSSVTPEIGELPAPPKHKKLVNLDLLDCRAMDDQAPGTSQTLILTPQEVQTCLPQRLRRLSHCYLPPAASGILLEADANIGCMQLALWLPSVESTMQVHQLAVLITCKCRCRCTSHHISILRTVLILYYRPQHYTGPHPTPTPTHSPSCWPLQKSSPAVTPRNLQRNML